MKGLSVSMQHYIKAVYELSDDGAGVRISDIAVKVGVTKASACIAMQALQKKAMVKRDTDRLVFLTASGERQAILSYDKYMIIKQFLEDVLKVNYEIAAVDACAIEHVISIETLCSLCRFTNRKCIGGCYAKADTANTKAKATM